MHGLALGSVSGHEMISPGLVLRTQPQNSIMPMLLFLWYLRLLPISNWTTFLVVAGGHLHLCIVYVLNSCSLACDQEYHLGTSGVGYSPVLSCSIPLLVIDWPLCSSDEMQ